MNFLKYIVLVLLLALFEGVSFGQGWEKKLSAELHTYAASVVQTPDDGFIVTGYGDAEEGNGMYILKTDAWGQIEWELNYPDSVFSSGYHVVELEDENYVVHGSGSQYKTYIKLDLFGEVIWSIENENFIGSLYSGNIVPTPDGGLVICGGYPFGDSAIQKISSDGDIEWTRFYDWGNDQDGLLGLANTENNGFIVAGFSKNLTVDSTIAFLIKVDSLGNQEWMSFPGPDSSLLEVPYDVVVQNDGYVAAGFGNSETKLWKTDLAGNFLWERTLEPFTLTGMAGTHDGGFILTGILGSEPGLILSIVDSSGVEKNRFFYGDNLGTAGYDLITTRDKGVFITGFSTEPFGATGFLVKTDSLYRTFTNGITGRVAVDSSQSCTVENEEYYFGNFIITAEGEGYNFFNAPDSTGNYFIETDTGNFIVNIVPINPYWTSCEDSIPVYFPNFFDTIQIDFPLQPDVECPYMNVDLATPFLRRCFPSTYHVNYCNLGTIATDSAYIEIVLDTFLTYLSSSIPLSSQAGGTLTFQLGTVNIGECGNFTIEVEVSCDAELGQTHCTEAYIFPDSLCLPAPFWSGAQIQVEGACVNDTIFFNVQNIGDAPTSQVLPFLVIEDDVVLFPGDVPILDPQQSVEYYVAATGSTYRMVAQQEPDFPGGWSMPSATVEACGSGGFSFGFTNQFPQDDQSPFIDIDCRENIGSYDPNDKQGFPTGWGDEHFIEQNTDIEYLIRFQNTGTDTAFRVIIRDTLSPFLEPASVRPGVASHPYEFDLVGTGVLKFTFDDILLPDSTTNLAASQGFVKFRISQKPEVPLTSVIENSAAIFFDFNAPIITNTTFHTVGDILQHAVKGPVHGQSEVMVEIVPNPLSGVAVLKVQGMDTTGENLLTLFDGTGRFLLSQNFSGAKTELDGSALKPGLYFFRIENENGQSVAGKVAVQ